jgi:uncharacterized protein YjbI with pentapeptide repeats
LSGANLDGTILAGSFLGCESISGEDFCTILDNATLCGADLRSAVITSSLVNVDASSARCGEPANFAGARFDEMSLESANLENAILEDATFDNSVTLCSSSGDCVNLTGASLIGASFSSTDFDEIPDDFFTTIAGRDLSEVDFNDSDLSSMNLEGMNLSFADLTRSDLRLANLRGANFRDAEFADGGETSGSNCELPTFGKKVDLRGADLSGADFSRAKNFQDGCIRVDETTIYNASTKFPPGFSLLREMSIPEPDRNLLQIAAILVLAALASRRRYTAAL